MMTECIGGPLDGQLLCAQGTTFMAGIGGGDVATHRYDLVCDDTGARYWRYMGQAETARAA